jgi:chromosome segregation ATPase
MNLEWVRKGWRIGLNLGRRLARRVAWQWSWLTMNPTLQEVVAERNAAIRLAVQAQKTAYHLQEQVSRLQTLATSGSIEQELDGLSLQISQIRRLLGNAQNNSGDSELHLTYRQLDAAEAAYKRLLQEINSRRKEIEGIRDSLKSCTTRSVDKFDAGIGGAK